MVVEPTMGMWVVLAVIAVAITAYATERVSLELTSIAVVAFLTLYFYIFPVIGPGGENLLDARALVMGLADPALITVLALLVLGQAVVRTGALDGPAKRIALVRRRHPVLAIGLSFCTAALISAVLNNTPVVVIFIPLMTGLAQRLGRSVSGVMMPLSFVCILGGTTTLIGSSTNLLVAGAAEAAGLHRLGFFDFTVPGLIIASIGLVYVFVVAPRLLPDRASLADAVVGPEGKQFIAELEVKRSSPLAGTRMVAGRLPNLPDVTIRLVQRGEDAMLPPFDDVTIEPGDELVIAATRQVLADIFAADPSLVEGIRGGQALGTAEGEQPAGADGDLVLAEAVVAPASRIIGRNLKQIVFHHRTRTTALAIQRRSRMIRQTMSDIRLEAGDVLLILGHRRDVERLRANPDVILLEWSARELPALDLTRRTLLIFGAVVIAAASGLVPVMIAAVAGAAAVIATGCLNIHQAERAVDRRVVLLIWSALAMGTALTTTGGAAYLATGLLSVLQHATPQVVMSAFFLLVALFTNILSNNATAVLFTPIAIGIAAQLGVDPLPFVITVIFAANCSFASPIGYQTNLLVMGPGHYRFSDFVRAGTPLIVIVWLTASFVIPWYYGLT